MCLQSSFAVFIKARVYARCHCLLDPGDVSLVHKGSVGKVPVLDTAATEQKESCAVGGGMLEAEEGVPPELVSCLCRQTQAPSVQLQAQQLTDAVPTL